MGTLTIGADTFTVYGTAAGLATRANGSSTYYATYAAAVAASVDGVSRVHVEATEQIKLLPFTDAANADPDTAAADVVTACYELVLAALLDPAVLTQDSTRSNVKRIEAKGVAVEKFAPTAGARFPARVMALLAPLLDSGAAAGGDTITGGSFVAGTGACSDFDESDRYGLTSA